MNWSHLETASSRASTLFPQDKFSSNIIFLPYTWNILFTYKSCIAQQMLTFQVFYDSVWPEEPCVNISCIHGLIQLHYSIHTHDTQKIYVSVSKTWIKKVNVKFKKKMCMHYNKQSHWLTTKSTATLTYTPTQTKWGHEIGLVTVDQQLATGR